jgi:hypothetical protein
MTDEVYQTGIRPLGPVRQSVGEKIDDDRFPIVR